MKSRYVSLEISQGRLVQTGRPLDVALSGKGFLVLETPEGNLYTRNGVLRASADGRLVDAEGRSLLGASGPITVPSSVSPLDLGIAEDGRVLAAGREIGRLHLVEFEDPKVLEPVGNNALRAPEDVRPADATATTVQQGYQEASNVEVVTELVALIKVSRLYEANARAMAAMGDRNKAILQVAMA